MSIDADTLLQFKKHGDSASYHYADDSGGEWGVARDRKTKALELFDSNPPLQAQMREIAKGFLWSLKTERPEVQWISTRGLLKK